MSGHRQSSISKVTDFWWDLASLQMHLDGNFKKPDIFQKELGADLQREFCAQSCRWGLQRPQIRTQPFLPARQISSSAIGFSCASLFAGVRGRAQPSHLPCRTPSVPQTAMTWVQDLGKHRTSTKLPQGLLSKAPGTSCPEAWLQGEGFQNKAWL